MDWLENIVAGWNFTYGGRIHNVQVDGRAGLTQFVLRKMAHFGSNFCLALHRSSVLFCPNLF